ncbi:YciI family protein [Bradyrhizobium sp. B097]|uniref:YciI family protein n=1 Tax=Bradyrhizobium sp. B097 TaxID=3140244 RepID=UPI0031839E3E
MLTVVRCLYRPGGADARLSIRDVHLEYMIANRNSLEQGGALMDEDGTVKGMFLILRGNRAEVDGLMANEPYTRAGLFEATTIECFDRFVPHADPRFLEKLLMAAREWILRNARSRV